MAKRPQGRAFVLDGVRYVGSPPHSALPRVQFVDMREIGQPMREIDQPIRPSQAEPTMIGVMTDDEDRNAAETLAVETEEPRKSRRSALPPLVSAPEPDPAATDTEE
jgi:hypothetical protein